MRLVELFTDTRDVHWEEEGALGDEATFETDDGKKYRITFYNEPLAYLKRNARNMPDVLEKLNMIADDAKIARVEFSLQDEMGSGQYDTKYGRTGTGNQYVVFATVIDAIKKYTQQYGFDHIRIVAEEPSRQRLYRRMIKSMSHKNVYTNKEEGTGIEAYIIEL